MIGAGIVGVSFSSASELLAQTVKVRQQSPSRLVVCWQCFILFCLLPLSGCSEKWEVELFNVSDSAILVSVGTKSYLIEPGRSSVLERDDGDVVVPGLLSIWIEESAFCYDLPTVRSGGRGEFVSNRLRVRLMLDRNGLLFVYVVPQKGFVVGQPPGDQPTGYPVEPARCDGASHPVN